MTRARLEFSLAGICAALAILTAFVPDWMEVIFKVDPDAGSGALEWMIVAAFGALAVFAAGLARRHYRVRNVPATGNQRPN